MPLDSAVDFLRQGGKIDIGIGVGGGDQLHACRV